MKKLNLRKIIILSLSLALLIGLGTKFVFADDELTKFDNFKKVQTYKEGTFLDVKETDWFHDYVTSLFEYKLMIGKSETLFDTENNLKVCEAMTLAVRLNATYTGNTLPEEVMGKFWYLPYVDYLREKQILNPDDYDLEGQVTRREFAEIFSKSLPDEAFKAINDVKEGMIPDVTGDFETNKAIYTLFRSGVLTGMDESRRFEPNRTIKRSEAAAVVSRIINPMQRINLGLPIVEVPPVQENKPSGGGGGGGGSSGGGGGGGNPPASSDTKDYFCITNNGNATFKVTLKENDTPITKLNLEVTTNKNDTSSWTDLTFNSPIDVPKGGKLYFRNKDKVTSFTNYNEDEDWPDDIYYRFIIDDDLASDNENNARADLSGDLMSLLSKDCEALDLSAKNPDDDSYLFDSAFYELFMLCDGIKNAKDLKMPSTVSPWCFYELFYQDKNLVSAPNLPATDLTSGEDCYEEMFSECTSLVAAPEISAVVVGKNSCKKMFAGCSELKTVPDLKATTLGVSCYNGMFEDCTKLEVAPKIEATTLASYCCQYMFSGCEKLKTVPDLPDAIADGCYNYMFYKCTGLEVAPALPAPELAEYCYTDMFNGCTSLEVAPALPAPELAVRCYDSMFYGCTKLVEAPTLSATTLAKNSCCNMFKECTSLAVAPELPATELAESCYFTMFEGCTSLEVAPALPATELAEYCYYSMFRGCTSLEVAPALPATTLAKSCYNGMFEDCTKLEVAPALPATDLTGASDCYKNMFDGCTSLDKVVMYSISWDKPIISYYIDYMLNGTSNVKWYCPSSICQSLELNKSNWHIPSNTEIIPIPEVGELVKLDNDASKMFRVVKRDGYNLEVIAEETYLSALYDNHTEDHYHEGTTIHKYDGSNIDHFLNETYYNSLSDNIKNAIVPVVVNDEVVGQSQGPEGAFVNVLGEGGLNVFLSVLSSIPSMGNKNIYILSFKEIVEFTKAITGIDVLSFEGLSELYKGLTLDDNNYINIWTRGMFDYGENPIFYTLPDALPNYTCDSELLVVPAFTVDMTKVDVSSYEDYLTITTTSDNPAHVILWKNKDPEEDGNNKLQLEYSVNKKVWGDFEESYDIDEDNIEWGSQVELQKGETLYIRNKSTSNGFSNYNTTNGEDTPYYQFIIDDDEYHFDYPESNTTVSVDLSGNIMSLLSKDFDIISFSQGYDSIEESCSYDYAFSGLFKGNNTIKNAKDLVLPSWWLSKMCYSSMFSDCANLETAPKLPATELDDNCYSEMFKGCTSLEKLTIGFNTFDNLPDNATDNWLTGVNGENLTITCPTGSFAEFSTSPVPSGTGSEDTFPDGTTLVR